MIKIKKITFYFYNKKNEYMYFHKTHIIIINN